jgi:pimeloyl-ACP methyl ester carboxylesterase
MTAGEVLGIAASGAAAVAALAAVHYAFWTRRLALPTAEDEVLRFAARDGWPLALSHRRPRAAARVPPVLLLHGIATNRQFMDFGMDRYSLAAHLSAAGLDCWTLELRGHGRSRRRPRGASRRWNLDTYLREDVPAALDAIRAATGEDRVAWVAHSQGAILGMATCGLHPDRVAALVAIAGPTHFDVQERLRRLVKLRFLLGGRFTRVAARMIAPFSGYWHPGFAELAIHMRNVDRRVYRRLLANGIENLQPGVLAQFATFVREDSFRSMDGRVDYRALLRGCRQPALFLSAEKDGLAPPSVVEAAFREWGGPKRYWNFGRDYGHSDLVLGRNAPDVVFPMIRDFLLEATRPAGSRPGAGVPARHREA